MPEAGLVPSTRFGAGLFPMHADIGIIKFSLPVRFESPNPGIHKLRHLQERQAFNVFLSF